MFSSKEVAQIVGLQESRVRYWAQTGFVGPSAKNNGRASYSFQDLVGLKTAKELLDRGLPVFGPTRDAAMIEGSKTWARELCLRHGIPGPLFGAFTDPSEARGFLDRLARNRLVKR